MVERPYRDAGRATARALVTIALVSAGGCKMLNPAWGPETSEGPSATDPTAPGTSQGPSPTETAGPLGEDTSGEDTSGATTNDSSAAGTTTTGVASSTSETFETTDTSDATDACDSPELVVELLSIEDAFFVNPEPPGGALCGAACPDHNFGVTSTLNLARQANHLRLFAIQFPGVPAPYDQFPPAWIIQVRVSVPIAAPAQLLGLPVTLSLHRLAGDAWPEGVHNNMPAEPGDSSFRCRELLAPDICVPWADDMTLGPMAAASLLTTTLLEPGIIEPDDTLTWVVEGVALAPLLDWFEAPAPAHRGVIIRVESELPPTELEIRTLEFNGGQSPATMSVVFACPGEG